MRGMEEGEGVSLLLMEQPGKPEWTDADEIRRFNTWTCERMIVLRSEEGLLHKSNGCIDRQ